MAPNKLRFTQKPFSDFFPTRYDAFWFARDAGGMNPGQNWTIFKCSGQWFATNMPQVAIRDKYLLHLKTPIRMQMRDEVVKTWTPVTTNSGFVLDEGGLRDTAMHAPEYAAKHIENYMENGARREYKTAELVAMLSDVMRIKAPTANRYIQAYTNSPECKIHAVRKGSWVWGEGPRIQYQDYQVTPEAL